MRRGRDLPERFGPRSTCYNRIPRWRKAGVWNRLVDAITAACDGDIQMIDSTSIRAHQQAATAKWGSRSLPGSLPKASDFRTLASAGATAVSAWLRNPAQFGDDKSPAKWLGARSRHAVAYADCRSCAMPSRSLPKSNAKVWRRDLPSVENLTLSNWRRRSPHRFGGVLRFFKP